jgi:hypothetical protein
MDDQSVQKENKGNKHQLMIYLINNFGQYHFDIWNPRWGISLKYQLEPRDDRTSDIEGNCGRNNNNVQCIIDHSSPKHFENTMQEFKGSPEHFDTNLIEQFSNEVLFA